MNAVKNWSAVISGSVLLCVILEFLIPPGKVGKSMNIILGAFVMCSAIGWFKSFDVRNFKSSFNLKKFEAPEEKTKKSKLEERRNFRNGTNSNAGGRS